MNEIKDEDIQEAADMSANVLRIADEIVADVSARSTHKVCPGCLQMGMLIYAQASLRAVVEAFPDDLAVLAPQIAAFEIKMETLITGATTPKVVQ